MELSKEDLESDPVFSGPKHEFRERLVLKMLKSIKKGKILDAGCGIGGIFFKLIKDYEVYGIDISEVQLNALYKEASKKNLEINGKVQRMDMKKMSFSDETFDAVICGEVLEHIKEDYDVVKEFNRVLKINGSCVVTVPANPKLWDFNDELSGHVRRYRKKNLRKLFESNGFKIEKISFYGFPIMRFYTKYIYSSMLKRKIKNEANNKKINVKIVKYNKIYPLMSYIFDIDKLFNWSPFGIGLIVKARKIK